MNPAFIINCLQQNKAVFKALLVNIEQETYLWKPAPDKWCLLEIICHLHDEEREDFRARVKHALETPDQPLLPIDPQGWVTKRQYMEQNYAEMVTNFLKERDSSIEWLNSLGTVEWNSTLFHPDLGAMSAWKFLNNWLAHDYLHIRQINRVKYQFLQSSSRENLSYAGKW